ncbi:MAG: hypothetical protein V4657_07405 [Pseudomonadota bacterium]
MPAGRPTDYKAEYATQAQKLCDLGATDTDLADFFEVTERTINRWKINFPEFCQSLKLGKDAADDRVEQSLYRKATGYTFNSEKIFQNSGEIIRANTVEHVPPSDTAAIFWLKNRRGDKWRDKQEIDLNATGALADIIAGRRAKVADMNNG